MHPKSFFLKPLYLTRPLKLLQQNRAQEVTGVVSRSVPSLTCPCLQSVRNTADGPSDTLQKYTLTITQTHTKAVPM